MSFNNLIDSLSTSPKLFEIIRTTSFICFILFLIITVILVIIEKNILATFSALLCVLSIVTSFTTSIYTNSQQEKHANDYTLSRDKTHFYVNSRTDYLKSAKFKILGENKDYIYVQKDNDTYNIPKIQERK